MYKFLFAAAAVICMSATAFAADLKLDQFFTDNAVFQQNAPVKVTGSSDPDAEITLMFGTEKISGKADAKGRWQIVLPAQKSGGPMTLTVSDGKNTKTVSNVMVGEVWLVSGQSNAYFPLKRFKEQCPEWLKDSSYPNIRFMTMTWQPPHMRKPDRWNVCSPETAENFSATGFFFARALQKQKNLPVGIIVAAADGSIIQKWLSEDALKKVPGMQEQMAKYGEAVKKWDAYQTEMRRRKTLPEAEQKTLPELKRPGYPVRSYADLFEQYIQPVMPFPVRGVIWYQGEANAMFAQGYPYRFYLREMIRDWRAKWNVPDLPFFVVQLPFYENASIWGDLRDSQRTVSLQEKNVYLVPTLDIGDCKNIHPPKKPELGQRLSLFALKYIYGKNDVICQGPVFRSAVPDNTALVVTFDTDSPIVSSDGQPLRGLFIAGENKTFYPADVTITDGKTLRLSSPKVPKPVAVRYGWRDLDAVNFFNQAGIPAPAFRSDDWKLPTQR